MKKLFEKIKVWIKEFIADWKEDTPKRWKVIRDVSGATTTAILILSGVGSQFPALEVPYWFSHYGWYIAGVCALITGYSGKQKITKSDEDKI